MCASSSVPRPAAALVRRLHTASTSRYHVYRSTNLVASRIIQEYAYVFDNEPVLYVSQMQSLLQLKLHEAQIKDAGEVLDIMAQLMTMKVTCKFQRRTARFVPWYWRRRKAPPNPKHPRRDRVVSY